MKTNIPEVYLRSIFYGISLSTLYWSGVLFCSLLYHRIHPTSASTPIGSLLPSPLILYIPIVVGALGIGLRMGGSCKDRVIHIALAVISAFAVMFFTIWGLSSYEV